MIENFVDLIAKINYNYNVDFIVIVIIMMFMFFYYEYYTFYFNNNINFYYVSNSIFIYLPYYSLLDTYSTYFNQHHSRYSSNIIFYLSYY